MKKLNKKKITQKSMKMPVSFMCILYSIWCLNDDCVISVRNLFRKMRKKELKKKQNELNRLDEWSGTSAKAEMRKNNRNETVNNRWWMSLTNGDISLSKMLIIKTPNAPPPRKKPKKKSTRNGNQKKKKI